MGMTVYERLDAIRGCLLAARRFELLDRGHPAVVEAATRALLAAADLAEDLPASLAVPPELPWDDLREVTSWRHPKPRSGSRLWAKLDAVEPLAEAVFIVASGGWDGDAFAGCSRSGWFKTDKGTDDYSHASELGSVSGTSELHVPGIGSYPCSYLAGSALWLQLTDEAADALSGSGGMHAWARRLEMGRVREDGSTPLEPPSDSAWVQGVLTDATLVAAHAASATGRWYLRLGQLPLGLQSFAVGFGHVQVIIVVSDNFLPPALLSVERTLIQARKAWGAWSPRASKYTPRIHPPVNPGSAQRGMSGCRGLGHDAGSITTLRWCWSCRRAQSGQARRARRSEVGSGRYVCA